MVVALIEDAIAEHGAARGKQERCSSRDVVHVGVRWALRNEVTETLPCSDARKILR